MHESVGNFSCVVKQREIADTVMLGQHITAIIHMLHVKLMTTLQHTVTTWQAIHKQYTDLLQHHIKHSYVV